MRSASVKLQTVTDARVPSEIKSTPSKLAISLTLAAMSLGYGVVQLDVTIVNTALNAIGMSLGGGVAELQWVVSAYTIAFAAFILTAGALGDRIGAKRVFMAGFAIFTAASVACALAPNATILIAALCVQGLAAAILVPNSLALLSHAYADDTARGRAVGILAAGAILSLTPGPFFGGGSMTLVGWRSIFLVNLPIGLAGLWLTGDLPARPRARPSARSICPASSPPSQPLARSPARSSRRRAGLGRPLVIAASLHRPCWRCCSSGECARRSRCCRCRCFGTGCSH